MKKRTVSFFMAILMLSVLCLNSYAVSDTRAFVTPRSSAYLESYGVSLGTRANHVMAIGASVDGTGLMTRIGLQEVYIEQKINGVWSEFDTWYGADSPSVYFAYNTYSYANTFYFTGSVGVQYRVTLTVYARNASGSDTGTAVSYTVTCT